MTTARRTIGAIVMALSVVMMIACIFGIVEAWQYRQRAIDMVEDVAEKLNEGIQRATTAGKNVQNALDLARDNVAAVNRQSSKLKDESGVNRFEAGILRGMIQRQVGPNVSDLSGRIAVMSDAALAVSSLLHNLRTLPAESRGRIDASEQTRWANQASQLAAKLQQLQGIVGDSDQQATEKGVTDAAREVDQVLDLCQKTLSEWQLDLAVANERLPVLRSETLYWLHAGVIIITILCVWAAIGQISLFVHAWGWLRH